jgi:replicative DNA helicase
MTESFLFTPVYQQAIIGWMIKDYNFFLECSRHLERDYFTDPKLSELFRIAKALGDRHQSAPLIEDVKNAIVNLHPKMTEHQPRIQHLEMCVHVSTTMVTLSILRDNLVEYVKSIVAKKGIIALESDWKRNQFIEVGNKIKETAQKIDSVRFAQDERVGFTINQLVQHTANLKDNACTIGNAHFDELITEGSLKVPEHPSKWRSIEHTTYGSLLRRELTMIIGPTNAGKTTMVSTIMAWNIIMKKKVLYISLEEKGDRIFRNMFQLIANETIAKLSAETETNAPKKALADTLLQEYFFMYEWFKPGDMYIEKLIAFIQSEHEKHVTHRGRGFDLVVIDYPQHLRSKELNPNEQKHSVIANNYIQCKLLANVCNLHVIAPIQSNRGGYVSSVRGKENRGLDGGDVGGSYDALQIADNVIAINRSNEDAQKHRIRFGLVKARNSKKGTTFCSRTNFSLSKTHGPDLPSTVVMDGNGEVSPEILDQTLGHGDGKLADANRGDLHHPMPGDRLPPDPNKPIESGDVAAFTATATN